MKQINVSKDRCIGCGACVAIDSEHFEFNEEGKSSVINNENLESENLLNAVESCPTCAIEIKETDNSEITNEQEENSDTEECDCEECHCEHCDCQAPENE